MRLGIDASTYFDVLNQGGRFYLDHKEIEPVSYLHDENGVDYFRIRLWLDPKDKKGNPYKGGDNDTEKGLALASFAASKGYDILLDFHYSDFWCDPAKQRLPKSWEHMNLDEICKAIADYTKTTLIRFKNHHFPIKAIQIGNEITNGMLWPLGRVEGDDPNVVREGYDSLCKMLNVGIKAAREIFPEASILLHLEKSYDQHIYDEFLTQMEEHQVNYDVLGVSYYPFWHGTFTMLFDNIDMVKMKFHKPVWIVETSYAHTNKDMEVENHLWTPVVNEELFKGEGTYKPYPLTQEGQADFVKTLLELSRQHGVDAVMYWEPLWIPVKNLTWASAAGRSYVKEEHKALVNEWANQCLFGYDGEATKALFEFHI